MGVVGGLPLQRGWKAGRLFAGPASGLRALPGDAISIVRRPAARCDREHGSLRVQPLSRKYSRISSLLASDLTPSMRHEINTRLEPRQQ